MCDSPDVPEALRGCEDTIFGNIQMIYEFHNRYVEKYIERSPQVIWESYGR